MISESEAEELLSESELETIEEDPVLEPEDVIEHRREDPDE